MSQPALVYASHPPGRDATNILLLGLEGIGKGVLAKAIVNIPADYTIRCFTATTLDQLRETAAQSRIDYVVFLVDTSRKISLDTTRALLEHVDAAYFLGRACFVSLRRGPDLTYEDECLLEVAGEYQTPVLFTELGLDTDVNVCAAGLVRNAATAAGMTDVTSLLMT